jgi:hypothetical protein
MTEAVTQGMLAVTLLFGVATIMAKAIILFRGGNAPRGALYLFMALVCAFFMVLSAVYSIDSFTTWRASN